MAETLEILVRARDQASSVFKSIGSTAGTSMSGAAPGVAKLGGAALSAGKAVAKLGLAVGAMAAGLALISAKVGKDFQQSITTVGTVAGATAEQMQLLEDTARDIGSTTAFSAKEAADAMRNLAAAGLDTTQIMGSAANAVKLAGATSGDMATATSLMAGTLRQFNIDAADSARVSDVFAAATSASMLTLQGLTDAMKFAGPIGAALGLTLEETTGAVAQFANLGLDASQAGTAFRMAMVNILNPTDGVKDALAGLGVEIDEINPSMNSFNEIVMRMAQTGLDAGAAVEIFGTRAGGAMAAIIDQARTGAVDLDAFNQNLVESAGTAADMYERMMDTVEGQWQILKSAVQEALISVFDSYDESLADLLALTSVAVGKITDAYNEIAPVIEFVSAAVAEFARIMGDEVNAKLGDFTLSAEAAREAAFTIIGGFEFLVNVSFGVIDVIGFLTQAVVAMAKTFLEAQLAINPVAMAIDAFTGTISGSIAALDSMGTAVAGGRDTLDSMKESFDKAITGADLFVATMNLTTEAVAENAEATTDAVKTHIGIIPDVMAESVQKSAEAVAENAPLVDEAFVDMGDSMLDTWEPFTNRVVASGGDMMSDLAAGITQGSGEVAAAMQAMQDSAVETIQGTAEEVNAITNALASSLPQGFSIFTPAGSAFGMPTATGFADGGIVTRPTLGLVGEREPELIIPLSKLGGGGGTTTVNVQMDFRSVIMPSDAEVRSSVRRMFSILQEETARRA